MVSTRQTTTGELSTPRTREHGDRGMEETKMSVQHPTPDENVGTSSLRVLHTAYRRQSSPPSLPGSPPHLHHKHNILFPPRNSDFSLSSIFTFLIAFFLLLFLPILPDPALPLHG